MAESRSSDPKSTAEINSEKFEKLLEAYNSLRSSEESARDRIRRLLDRQKQDQWAMPRYVDILGQNRTLESTISSLERTKEELDAAMLLLEANLATSAKKSMEAEAEKDMWKSKCEKFEENVVSGQKMEEDLMARVLVLEAEKSSLERKCNNFGECMEDFKVRVSVLDMEKSSLMKKCEKLENENDALKRKLMEEVAAKERLEKEVEGFRVRVLGLEAEKSNIEKKCEIMEVDKSNLEKKCENLEATILLLGGTDESLGKKSPEMEMAKGDKIPPQIVELDDWSDSEKQFLNIPTPNRIRTSKVVLIDSEEDTDEDSMPIGMLMKKRHNRNADHNIEDVFERSGDGYLTSPQPSSTHRRKFASTVIRSDSEDDVNIPNSKLKRPRMMDTEEKNEGCDSKNNATKLRRLVKSGGSGTQTSSYSRRQSNVQRKLSYTTYQDTQSEEKQGEAGESDSDTDSIDDFIANSSESIEAISSSSESLKGPSISDDTSDDESTSDADVALGNVLDKLYRKRDVKEWEYETDMLAAFAKSPQLCMKAVCALYRLQTDEEKMIKGTVVSNGRGFNQYDASLGSKIAEFLLDGVTYGPVKKTAVELEAFYSSGLEYCLQLACRYSKQLFGLYQSKEDPYFP